MPAHSLTVKPASFALPLTDIHTYRATPHPSEAAARALAAPLGPRRFTVLRGLRTVLPPRRPSLGCPGWLSQRRSRHASPITPLPIAPLCQARPSPLLHISIEALTSSRGASPSPFDTHPSLYDTHPSLYCHQPSNSLRLQARNSVPCTACFPVPATPSCSVASLSFTFARLDPSEATRSRQAPSAAAHSLNRKVIGGSSWLAGHGARQDPRLSQLLYPNPRLRILADLPGHSDTLAHP